MTARYEAPASPVASSGSTVTSMPPVASERRREAPTLPQRAWLKLSAALTIAALVVAGVAWGIFRAPAREAGAQAVAPSEPAARGSAGSSSPPSRGVAPAESTTHAARRAPAEVEPEAPAPGEAPANAPPAQRVRVSALQPEPAVVAKQAPVVSAPAPSVTTSPGPATSPGLATSPGSARAPSPSAPPAAAPPPAIHGNAGSAPAPENPARAACTFFDPYTGRCTVAPAEPDVDRR